MGNGWFVTTLFDRLADNHSWFDAMETLPEGHKDEDVRFDIGPCDEDGYVTVLTILTVNGRDIRTVNRDCMYHAEVGYMIEACREVQAMPDYEERMSYYAERGL